MSRHSGRDLYTPQEIVDMHGKVAETAIRGVHCLTTDNLRKQMNARASRGIQRQRDTNRV